MVSEPELKEIIDGEHIRIPDGMSLLEYISSLQDDELTPEEIKCIEESLEDIKAGRVYSEVIAKRMMDIND